jgi:hypothetical protein
MPTLSELFKKRDYTKRGQETGEKKTLSQLFPSVEKKKPFLSSEQTATPSIFKPQTDFKLDLGAPTTTVKTSTPGMYSGREAKPGDRLLAPVLESRKEEVLEDIKQKIPVTTLPEKIGAAFERGTESVKMDFNMWEVLSGERDYNEALEENKKIEARLPKEPAKRNLPEKALVGAAEILSPMLQGGWRSIVGGLLGAGTASVAGRLIPGGEEKITVPTAATYGSMALGGKYWYKQGAGAMYADMRNEGINHEIAKNVSLTAALPYALIEYSQFGKLVPGKKELFKGAMREAAKKASEGLARKYGANWASEVAEEGMQEFVQVMSTNIGKWLDDNVEDPTIRLALRVSLEQSYKVMKESALPMAVLVGGSGAIDSLIPEKTETEQGETKIEKPEKQAEVVPPPPEEPPPPPAGPIIEKPIEPEIEAPKLEPKDALKKGREAFKQGTKRIFALDKESLEATKGMEHDERIEYMKDWYKGWDRENLKLEPEEKTAGISDLQDIIDTKKIEQIKKDMDVEDDPGLTLDQGPNAITDIEGYGFSVDKLEKDREAEKEFKTQEDYKKDENYGDIRRIKDGEGNQWVQVYNIGRQYMEKLGNWEDADQELRDKYEKAQKEYDALKGTGEERAQERVEKVRERDAIEKQIIDQIIERNQGETKKPGVRQFKAGEETLIQQKDKVKMTGTLAPDGLMFYTVYRDGWALLSTDQEKNATETFDRFVKELETARKEEKKKEVLEKDREKEKEFTEKVKIKKNEEGNEVADLFHEHEGTRFIVNIKSSKGAPPLEMRLKSPDGDYLGNSYFDYTKGKIPPEYLSKEVLDNFVVDILKGNQHWKNYQQIKKKEKKEAEKKATAKKETKAKPKKKQPKQKMIDEGLKTMLMGHVVGRSERMRKVVAIKDKKEALNALKEEMGGAGGSSSPGGIDVDYSGGKITIKDPDKKTIGEFTLPKMLEEAKRLVAEEDALMIGDVEKVKKAEEKASEKIDKLEDEYVKEFRKLDADEALDMKVMAFNEKYEDLYDYVEKAESAMKEFDEVYGEFIESIKGKRGKEAKATRDRINALAEGVQDSVERLAEQVQEDWMEFGYSVTDKMIDISKAKYDEAEKDDLRDTMGMSITERPGIEQYWQETLGDVAKNEGRLWNKSEREAEEAEPVEKKKKEFLETGKTTIGGIPIIDAVAPKDKERAKKRKEFMDAQDEKTNRAKEHADKFRNKSKKWLFDYAVKAGLIDFIPDVDYYDKKTLLEIISAEANLDINWKKEYIKSDEERDKTIPRDAFQGRKPEGERIVPKESGESDKDSGKYEEKGATDSDSDILLQPRKRPSTRVNKEREKLLADEGKAGTKGATGVGVLDNYFTPLPVIERVWNILDSLYLPKKPKVLEPAAGIGKFFEFAPKDAELVAYEPDQDNWQKMRELYPDADVKSVNFEEMFIGKRGEKKEFKADFDIVIGNPPYGTHRQFYKNLGEEPKMANYQEYFIKRGLDVLKEDGLLAYVVPSSFLRGPLTEGKKQIAKMANLQDSFRLPNGIFKNTPVGTDIVVFRKTDKKDYFEFIEGTEEMLSNDNYFKETPDNVLGTPTTIKGQWGPEPGVAGTMDEAMAKIDDTIPAKEKKAEPIEKEFLQPKKEKATTTTGEKKKAKPKAKKKPVVKGRKDIEVLKAPDNKKNKAISVSDVNSEAYALAKRTQVDGSIDTEGMPFNEIQKLNIMIGDYGKPKYYSDYNYYQGDIYKKLEQLENDRYATKPGLPSTAPAAGPIISKEQYERQKKGLEAVKPKQITVKEMHLNPADDQLAQNEALTFTDKDGNSGTLEQLFGEYMLKLDADAFGSSSINEVRNFIRGNRVAEGDKKQNAIVKTRRRETANRLFKNFIETQLDKKSEKKLEDHYNARFNAYAEPDNKANPVITTKVNEYFGKRKLEIRDYQYEAINFLVNKGVGTLAHEVGAGKTLSAIIAIHEVMERGWAKRPLIVVPNKALYNNWKKEIARLFPGRKIVNLGNLGGQYKGEIVKLAKEKYNLQGIINNEETSDQEAKRATDRIAEIEKKMKLPENTIAITTYPGLNKIGLSDENMEAITTSMPDKLLKGEKTERARQLENQKAEGMKGTASRNVAVELEDLGIDHITIDESHNYKNLFSRARAFKKTTSSEYSEITGGLTSKRAIKLYYLTQYILKNNNYRNVFGLTATPFTNSPLEIYNMLSYMAEYRLRERGIRNLHDFMTNFIDMKNKAVLTSNRKEPIKFKDVTEKYKNLQSLQELVKELFHFKSAEDLGIERPNKIRRSVVIEESSLQSEYADRAQKLWSDKKAGALRAIGEMRKIALSPYLSQYHEGTPGYKDVIADSPKLKYVMDAIRENKKNKDGKTAGQIIYLPEELSLIPHMTEYLVKEIGYKKEQISEMTARTMKSPEKAQKLIDDFNAGKTKIVIGSSTIVEGVNLQENTSDLYHLWLPWNPTDMIQVEGRAWRYGNKWKNVRIHYPLLTNSGDIKLFQLLETKGKRIKNIWEYTGKTVIDVSDIDPEELKSELITDPLIALSVEKTFEIKKLNAEIDAAKGEKGMVSGRIGKYFEYQDKVKRWEEKKREQMDADGEVSYYTEQSLESAKRHLEELKERLPGENIKQVEARVDKIRDRIAKMETELKEIDDKYKAKEEEIKKNPPKKKNLDETEKALAKIAEENKAGFFALAKEKEKKQTGFLEGAGMVKEPSAYGKQKSYSRKAGVKKKSPLEVKFKKKGTLVFPGETIESVMTWLLHLKD